MNGYVFFGDANAQGAMHLYCQANDDLSIPKGEIEKWLGAEREQDIQMELLRDFVAHFTVFYAVKLPESGTEEDGGR